MTQQQELIIVITVLMLGSFVLEVDGTLISAKSWKSQKALALFKFLAHMPGKKVPRDRIIEILWSDSEMTSAPTTFTQLCTTCAAVFFHSAVVITPIR